MRRIFWLIPTTIIASQIPLSVCSFKNESKNSIALILEIPEHATVEGGVRTIIVNKGSKWSDIQLPKINYDYGYGEDYWTDKDGNVIDANTVFNKTTYINLHIKSLSKITITFQPDDDGYGALDYDSIEVWEGTKWSDIEKPFVFLTEKGQTYKQRFNKWVDSEGKDIPESQVITSNFTAKASFEAIQTITLTFKSGDHGKFADGTDSTTLEVESSSRWWAISKPFIEEEIAYDVDKWIYEDTQEAVSLNDEFLGDRTVVAQYKNNVATTFEKTSWKNIGKFARDYEKELIDAEKLCKCFTDVEYNSAGTTESEKLQNFIDKQHVVHLNEITHHVRIIGTAVDTIDDPLWEFPPKAAFSFEFIENATIKVNTIPQCYQLFKTAPTTYEGSRYSSSDLWTNVLSSQCLYKLDNDLQQVIKPVVKYCLKYTRNTQPLSVTYEVVKLGDGTGPSIPREKIWLLGLANIFSSAAIDEKSWVAAEKQAYKDEQSTIGQYQYYQNTIGEKSIDSDVAKQILIKTDAGTTRTYDRWLTTQTYGVSSSSTPPGGTTIKADGTFNRSADVTSNAVQFCPCFSI